MSETEQIINNIIKISDMLKEDLWGIRNKASRKFINVGLIGNQLLICDSTNWMNVAIWYERESAEKVCNIICDLQKDFIDNYFVDKLSEKELKEYRIENKIELEFEPLK